MLRDYFETGRKLMAEESSAKALHQFRLDTKRARYTLELFRPLYGPGLETPLAGLRRIQDYLGAISDCDTTKETIAGALPETAPERGRLAGLLDARAKRSSTALRKYWRQTFDKPGDERRWTLYLARQAGIKRNTAR
jgi:CHAD domain-containing protein